MMGSEQQRRNKRAAKGNRADDTRDPARKEIDRAISDVRQNTVDRAGTNAMTGQLIIPFSPTTSNSATRKQYVDNGLAGKASDPHNHDDRYPRKSDSTATSLNNTNNEHSHSLSSTFFIKLSKTERRRMLVDRLLNRAVMDDPLADDAIRIVARNMENQLSLLMDYRELNAFERERRFDDPEWSHWTEEYKRVYGVDEYSELDRSKFLSYGRVRMDPYEGIAPTEEA
jgi:hypothetical protein